MVFLTFIYYHIISFGVFQTTTGFHKKKRAESTKMGGRVEKG